MFKDDDLVVLDRSKLIGPKICLPPENVYSFGYVKQQKKLLRKQHGEEVIFLDRYRLATIEEIENAASPLKIKRKVIMLISDAIKKKKT